MKLVTRHSNSHRFAPMRVGFVLRRKNTMHDASSQQKVRRTCPCMEVLRVVIVQQTSLINLFNGRVKTQIPIARYLNRSLQ